MATFDDTEMYFRSFCQKIQHLLSQHRHSRHVIFTHTDVRQLRILYTSQLYECTIYSNHQCHLCIIYGRQDVVAMDINTRWPPNGRMKGFMKHAETNAVRTLLRERTPPAVPAYGMLIVRFVKDATMNNSRPCCFCARLIKKNISYFHSIAYTDKDGGLIVMAPHEFRKIDFHHQTKRHRICTRGHHR